LAPLLEAGAGNASPKDENSDGATAGAGSSSSRAAVTIVDATGAQSAIRISASDVVIGRRNRGFTFTGAGTEGAGGGSVAGTRWA
jgi:hypothetical protein